MLRRRFLALVVILGLLAVLSGCATEPGEQEEDAAVAVFVAKAEMGRLSRGDFLTGKVAARAEIHVVPKMAGKVAAVTVDVGDRVQAGQVLLRFEVPELEAQLRQAEAGVAQAESGLVQAQLSLEQAEADYERMKYLFDQEAIPAAEFEKVEMNYKMARDQAENLRPAQLRQAEAQLEYVQANLANAVVASSITGLVAARNVDPGEMASQTTPVFTIVDIDQVRVEVSASEKLVNRIKTGQEVAVLVTAVSSEPLTGKVFSVAPAADPRTRTYPVRIELPNPEHQLKPGMFAEVDFGTAEDESVLVPRDAVFQRAGVNAVFVYADGRVEFREVVPGPSDGRTIVVHEGLETGETVVVSGQDVLEDGMEVEASEMEVDA
ncbi:MAG: efflux RND transporter periplasmic adaptor subunit [Candidatus Desulforudis sp.]|nr:efflux RND transporter periplasmic adaptor subunit [Desulforudis sp.]